jgi:hypothetical protein
MYCMWGNLNGYIVEVKFVEEIKNFISGEA